MQPETFAEQALDAKIDRILVKLKRVFLAFFIVLVATAAIVLVLEIKREFSIDLIQGVNFSVDDWYFDNIAGN